MLRLSLHFVLATAFAAGPSGPKEKSSPGCRNPDALYEEGRKDFNQKFTKSAIEKFEEAYKCSKDPLILYNIGLAYKRVYESEKQLEQLQRAKKALSDYVEAIEKDPNLGADPEEVRPILAEIDAELERITPKEPEPEGPVEPPTPEPPPVDPGKSKRVTGIALIGVGGGMMVAGTVVGAIFADKGVDLRDQLDTELYPDFKTNGCGTSPDKDAPGANMGTCNDLRAKRSDLRDRGATVNGVAGGMLAVGLVGLGLAVGGAVLFAKGKRTSDAWKATQQARFRVAPTFGGLVLHGRF